MVVRHLATMVMTMHVYILLRVAQWHKHFRGLTLAHVLATQLKIQLVTAAVVIPAERAFTGTLFGFTAL